ncbi:MAG TPA: hypothetical protein VGW38_28430 [Chloroflexota bacterium]|nr:hypothetical protein [Chloroflexota bacterium]
MTADHRAQHSSEADTAAPEEPEAKHADERPGLDATEVALFIAMCGVLIIAGIVLWPAAVEDFKALVARLPF